MIRVLTFLLLLACTLTAQAGNIIGPSGQWAWYSKGAVDTTLKLWYPFTTSNASTVADATTNGNDGTVSGATWTTNGYDFSGVNQSIYTASNSALSLAAFSFSVWVKFDDATAADYEVLADRAAAVARNWNVYRNSSGGTPANGLSFNCFGNGSTWGASLTSTNVGAGTWHMVTCTATNGAQALYVDGRAKATATYSGTPTLTARKCTIGLREDNAYDLDGTLDQIRYYGRALASNEVWTLYGQGR